VSAATVAVEDAYTDAICSKRFARFEGDELMMLALTNCITSVVKLHLRNRPLFLHPSQAQAAPI
jgi:hypothetical protein